MKILVNFALIIASLSGLNAVAGQYAANADEVVQKLEFKGKLPPLPEGVAELKFSELYTMPVGPRGLEITDKVRALAGRRVRVFGFMVKQQKPSPGVAIISPFSLTTNEKDYDLADDLPPGVVFAKISKFDDIAVPFTPRPLLLTGVLEVGRQQEEDGRFSEFRLVVEEPKSESQSEPQSGVAQERAAFAPGQSAGAEKTPEVPASRS